MSVLNFSGDESPECPLCMELFELDDINFYPCACGYQVRSTHVDSLVFYSQGISVSVTFLPLIWDQQVLDKISFTKKI